MSLQAEDREKQQNIRLTVSYDGSCFGGWQRVENGKKPSVQATLEQVLEESFSLSALHVIGSGRTDAGVHAWGQVANVHVPKAVWQTKAPEEWRDSWNRQLPTGLRIRAVDPVPHAFHSRYDAVGKTYCYLFDTGEVPSVFARKYAYPVGTGIGGRQAHSPMVGAVQLDMNAIRQASVYLLGEHDFSAFASKMEPGRGTVRRIDRLEWKWISSPHAEGLLAMEVIGNGFLYHMVRILAGTLYEVGTGQRSPESIKKALASGSRQDAGVMLPGDGLVLMEVQYPE